MKTLLMLDNRKEELILFLGGWGMDSNPFRHLQSDLYDVCVVYDYHSPNLHLELPKQYKKIHLIAWSMGVWVASRLKQQNQLTFHSAIAINGTELPIDDEYGIPVAIYNGTLDHFSDDNRKRFNRRMCNDSATFRFFSAHNVERDSISLREELQSLKDMVECETPLQKEAINWDKAIIASDDYIFPTANLLRFWNGKTTVREIIGGHYLFNQWEKWDSILKL